MIKKIQFFIFTLSVVMSFLLFESIVSARTGQNPVYPTPSRCNGEAWNIGLPQGVRCQGTVTTGGAGSAMENDSKAVAIFGTPSRLKPDLNSLNTFCKQYTGDNTSYAIYGAVHNYCNGCDRKIAWWTGSYWNNQTVCAGTLNVQLVKCGTGCTSSSCSSHSSKKCVGNSIYWFNSCDQQEELVQSCVSNQTCQNAQCVSSCSSHSSKKCVGNSIYWFNSCDQQEELVQSCVSNQTCQNAQCVVPYIRVAFPNGGENLSRKENDYIKWESSDDIKWVNIYIDKYAGENGELYKDGPISKLVASHIPNKKEYFSYNGKGEVVSAYASYNWRIGRVQKNRDTEAGEISSSEDDKYSDLSDLFTDDFLKGAYYKIRIIREEDDVSDTATKKDRVEDSSDGYFNIISCRTDEDCSKYAYSEDHYVGVPYCKTTSPTSIYQKKLKHICKNPGRPDSYCTEEEVEEVVKKCYPHQSCQGGICTETMCRKDTDCGTNGWQGSPYCKESENAVYQDYVTYTCGTNWVCSYITRETLRERCGSQNICQNGKCVPLQITCKSDSDCGENRPNGGRYCSGKDSNGNPLVYQDYIKYTCMNPGTRYSYCEESTEKRYIETCNIKNQYCQNGFCFPYSCKNPSSCGSDGWANFTHCSVDGKVVYQSYYKFSCVNYPTPPYSGIKEEGCEVSEFHHIKEECLGGYCAYGRCIYPKK